MAIYSLAQRTTNVTINQATYELRTSAVNKARLMELGFVQNTGAAATTIGFGRPAALGITPVNVAFQAENDADPAAQSSGVISWGTSPTSPTIFLRRINLNASVAVGFIWIWPRGLAINPSSSVVLFNVTASHPSDVWSVIDE